jgi:glycosyltransferase involved in cell wall biosynthesis
VAHHSLRLAEELTALGEFDLDLFAEQGEHESSRHGAPVGLEAFSAGCFEAVESQRGGYHKILLAIGNSPNHIAALELLRRRSGVVIAHDVRLTNLYRFAARRRSTEPGGFAGSLRRMYGDELPPAIAASGRLSAEEEEAHGILMAREVIEHGEPYLVFSRAARALALLDVGAGAAHTIGVLPFAADLPTPGKSGFDATVGFDPRFLQLHGPPGEPPPQGSLLVLALGILHPVRQPFRLLEAFAVAQRLVSGARLAYVGPAPGGFAHEILERAKELGVSGSVVSTGQIATARYLDWIRSGSIAVQLRARSQGEASGTVGECMVAGLPVVASDIGWARELPASCLVKVDPRMSNDDLGMLIARLLVDDRRRAALRDAALGYAPMLSFRRAAEALAEELRERT